MALLHMAQQTLRHANKFISIDSHTPITLPDLEVNGPYFKLC